MDSSALGATIFGWKWYYEVTMETRGDDMTLAPYLALEVRVYDGMLILFIDGTYLWPHLGLTGLPHATLLHRVI